MAEYQKINTLFMRDDKNVIMPDTFTTPEFAYLSNAKWECTEKIDGTNIRFELRYHVEDNGVVTLSKAIKGRTDKANIPTHLMAKLQDIVNKVDFAEIFDNISGDTEITIFGEGYGTKIQKGGNYLQNDVNFILFDVRVGSWWLNREACEEIARKMNVPIVPLIGYMTIPEAIEYVKTGFKSTIAENKDYDAEGLVLKTPYGLQFRNGTRIITKIKTKDFRDYAKHYGDGPAVQTPNPKYK